jgi:catechol 2,3-dioxygenase-like lactoylglutathione lyase family enzyme
MILDFLVVLMTKNLSKQIDFYKDLLGLDLIFDNQSTIGLGKDNRLFIVLREDQAEESHHSAEHKGPQIITFKCQGNANQHIEKISRSGFMVRDAVKLPEYNTHYLFIEDYDGNEICLDFPLN